MTTDKIRKEKNQNIQVFIRLRPLNQRERDIKSLGVIEVVNNREVVVRQSQQTSHTKKFTFDRAFAPNSSQLQVYQEVVSPLIEEVLNGYNCTVFAYGQTGTGKTHTMVGEHTGTDTHWQNDPLAGIIPRALSQLFDELRLTNTEYTVRVSYLELYNEELFDLLASSEDNSKLRIYEDVTRKGSNIVNGLEEITVYNKSEVYKIMAQGQERKRVASTLMNAQSSRSHTVFTIVVHMKENSPEGEELVKIGKLNLVDLAGSENISKAGSDNPAKKERARECVNINQSLLTLGRVITALVERHPHIPYRESKLTRILQESLGGRTKTSIIATISPGHKDLEETMSTLEYAHRAKNIQNKPEVNQKMTKKAILKEYAEEIDRLKRDLQASRDKNGVYLASETYTEMTLKEEEQRKEIQELLLKKKAMEDERDRLEGVFSELNNTLENKNNELANTVNKLNNTKAELASTSHKLIETRVACEEQQHLVQAHCSTETQLGTQARQLLATADVVTTHVQCLHDTVDKRSTVESTNLELLKTYRSEASQHRDVLSSGLQEYAEVFTNTLDTLTSALDEYTTSTTQTQEQNVQQLETLVQTFVDIVTQLKAESAEASNKLLLSSDTHRAAVSQRVLTQHEHARSQLGTCLRDLAQHIQKARGLNVAGDVRTFVCNWFSGAAARVSSLQSAHRTFTASTTQARDEVTRGRRTQRDSRCARLRARSDKLQASIQEMQEESTRLQKRLTEQLSEIETERQDTESRLQDWMAEERNLLEERLARHVANERNALEERLAKHADIEKNALEVRLAKKIAEVKEHEKLLEERLQRYTTLSEIQMESDQEEMKMVEGDLEECVNWDEKYEKFVKKFGKEFEEGTNAINVDMEVFSENIVDVVEHLNNQLLQVVDQMKDYVEKEVTSVISEDESSSKQLVEATDEMFTNMVDTTKQIINGFIDRIESSNSSSVSALTSQSDTARTTAAAARQHAALHHARSGTARARSAQLQGALQRATHTLAGLDDTLLERQYKLYEPTGKTPSRTQYRYPRVLAATSPHDKILARFRAMRQNSDEDCILVESDSESRQTSVGSMSGSEESVFVTPSTYLPVMSAHKMVKCTSETEIYTMKKNEQQGKENTERSVSQKKPSKLPAPASHKKPLVERNGN